MLLRALSPVLVVCGLLAASCSSREPVRSAGEAPSVDGGAATEDGGAPVVTPPSGCPGAADGAPATDPFRRVRTATDAPDDAPDEYQVHALYVVPSDRVTATPRLDEDGSLRRTITAWNAWMATQLGGRKLRFDTCGGVIDVTYLALPAPFTEAALAEGRVLTPAGPIFLRDRLEAEIRKTFDHPKKLYLAFYDGRAYGSCGGAPLPPSLPGRVTALYRGGIFASGFLTAPAAAGATQLTVATPASTGLGTGAFTAKLGTEPVSITSVTGTTVTLAAPLASSHPDGEVLLADQRAPDCRSNPFSSNGSALGYADYAGAHEVLHALGIVSSAAPFHSTTAAAGHLTAASAGGTADLMYQGVDPWTCPSGTDANAAASTCVLDPAHVNYVDLPAGNAAVDLAKSVFLDPTPPGATPPPGW